MLEVAEEVFAEVGVSASTEEIARRAGVGVGTVFRHFPTKEALLEEVFVGRLRRLIDDASALAEDADPGTAFFTFFTSVVAESGTKNTYLEALSSAGVDVQDTMSDVGGQLRAALDRLLSAAQRAGAVRDDVHVPELIALLVGASQASRSAGWAQEVADRVLAVVLDGLRASSPRESAPSPTS